LSRRAHKITAITYLYGREIYYIGNEWCWAEDMTPIGMPWRVCPHCGKYPLEDHEDPPDPCMGWVPGIRYACCGHGNIEEAYVLLESDELYSGYDAILIIEHLRREL
jgi:hypothetical protein